MAKRGRRGGGPSRGSSHYSRGNLRNSFAPPSAAQNGSFSMRDVARNTETRGRERLWGTDAETRHKPITFVSGGHLAGSLPEKTSEQEKDLFSAAVARSENAMAQMKLDANEAPKAPPNEEPAPPSSLFFEDTNGSITTTQTGLPPPVIRSPSPTPSDSSEEVVLFKGRDHVRTIADPVQSDTPVINTPAASTNESSSGALPGNGKDKKPVKKWEATMASDDEAIADYLENIRAQKTDSSGEDQHLMDSINRRPLGEGDGGDWYIESSVESIGIRENVLQNPHKNDWDSPDLEDFDQLSTSSEMIGKIARILRKRERSSGIQYLVVFDKTTDDEARWISVDSVTEEYDKQVVTAYEDNVKNIRLGNETSDESWSDASEDEKDEEDDDDDDEEGDDDDDDDETEFEDEEDLIERRIERMSDEHIARLLGKQEELGLGADDLFLFDGVDADDDDDDDGDDVEQHLEAMLRSSRKKNSKGKRKDHFPSASLMADVLEHDPYNGFDVMDWERPSLRKRQKGKKANLPFELSDDELALKLKSTWEKDREKKHNRKKEREELRAQGLLGKKNKFKPDLSAKYDTGMTFEEIREELRVFLDSSAQSRPFPPMDKHQRAILHQIGAALNMNSKSVGSGNKRFTTLVKTSRTRPLNDYAFSKITSRFQHRFLPRGDTGGAGKRAGRGGGGGSGGKYGAASYRDGEVVGASAPEIGSENKGRAMLERMGWSAGMALGAVDNKGILQPVMHVVKTSKTGLG
ncbi:uncharacterized protein IWZ02DRAFT_252086 [Phyllosticta citriasiana]|uniref:uncharacterized protein n=1 Tax=Phyllosticta citriasiana TaxID=595635 RepID=UPI0030FD7F5D